MMLSRDESQATGLFGIGTDIIEIDRVRQAVERGGDRFLARVFTSGERAFCDARRDRFACYSARFAAKEAVLKAMGTGLSGCRWVDVEVSRADGGRPEIRLHGAVGKLAKRLGVETVQISLSHDRRQAVAFAVAIGKAQGT